MNFLFVADPLDLFKTYKDTTFSMMREAQRRGAGLNHFDGLRMAIGRNQKDIAFGFDRTLGQGHGFGSSGGLVQHGCIGNGHGRQVGDHGLEIDQRLHAALADFGLVRGVGGVPGGVFQNVAQDHARHMGAVVALADEVFENPVLAGDGFELGQRGGFGRGRWQVHGFGARNAARHDRIDQGAARGFANHREHHFFILR